MPKLALYDQERDSLAGHLDSVSVPELAGREPTPDSGGQRRPMQLGTDAGRRVDTRGSGPSRTQKSAPTGGSGAARARDRAAPTRQLERAT
jgi:hypothetical protein